MKFQKNIFLAFFAICFWVTSCQQSTSLTEDALINVPASTSSVTSFNVKRLMDKADFKEVQKMTFYEEMTEEVAPSIAAVLKDPYQSGIDLDANAYMTQNIDMVNPEDTYNAVVFSLKDKSAFKSLLTGKSNPEIKSGNGFEYFQPTRSSLVSWNDNLGVIALAQSSGADLKAGVEEIYNTTKENSIATNANLQKAFTKDADILSWFSTNSIAEAAKGNFQIAAMGLTPEMLKDNYMHGSYNFEKGEIVGDSQYEINKDFANKYRHFFKDEVKTNFGKHLEEENLAFAVAAGLDMKGIKMIVQNMGFMGGMVDGSLKEFGLSLDGLAKTFDGDLLVSGYRVDGQNAPNILLATKINDKDNFQKILELGEEYRMLTKAEDGVYNLVGLGANDLGVGDNPQLCVSGDLVFIGDANTFIGKIKSGDWGKNGLVGKKVKNVVSDNVMGAFVDFKTIGKYLTNMDIDFDAMEDAVMRMDRDDATINVAMKDKNTNSLKSLIQALNKAYENKTSM